MGKIKEKDNLFKMAIIEKRNVLNEVHRSNLSLQELRFFSIYLSKINSRDTSTRKVRFPLSDFKKIMEFGRLNISQLKESTDRLLQHIVHIPNENSKGYTSFQLFKECCVSQDDSGEWYIEIDAHDKALPLMFDFKEKYFTYELWNALRLKSTNQIRMYEILKQYEKIGKREISVIELREQLGIKKDEYDRFERFRVRVLDGCQKALLENTDIAYTYQRGKIGKSGKWLTIVFYIFKNENHKDPLTLDKFIDLQQKNNTINTTISSNIDEKYIELYNRYFKNRNFKKSDAETIIIKLTEKVNSSGAKVKQLEEVEIYLKNLMESYDKQRGKKTLENKIGYILGMIENNAFIKQEPEYRQREEQSYNINEFEKYAINYEELKKVEEQSEDIKRNSDVEETAISENNFKAETIQQFFERIGYKE